MKRWTINISVAGFVLQELKTDGITKEGLQTVGQNPTESQPQNVDVNDGLAKQVVC
jgi:hypothetical protein